MDPLSLRNELAANDGRDSARFAVLLLEVKTARSLTDQWMADRFGVSRRTISRWLSGRSAPHPGFRPFVLRSLAKLIIPIEDFDPRALGMDLSPDDHRFDHVPDPRLARPRG